MVRNSQVPRQAERRAGPRRLTVAAQACLAYAGFPPFCWVCRLDVSETDARLPFATAAPHGDKRRRTLCRRHRQRGHTDLTLDSGRCLRGCLDACPIVLPATPRSTALTLCGTGGQSSAVRTGSGQAALSFRRDRLARPHSAAGTSERLVRPGLECPRLDREPLEIVLEAGELVAVAEKPGFEPRDSAA